MDNPEKLATQGIQDGEKTPKNPQHNMRWTPLYVNKHKQRKQDMSPPTNNWTYWRY